MNIATENSPSPSRLRITRPLQPSDPDVRWDLVDRVRGEIAAGQYLDDRKVEGALLRLAECLT